MRIFNNEERKFIALNCDYKEWIELQSIPLYLYNKSLLYQKIKERETNNLPNHL